MLNDGDTDIDLTSPVNTPTVSPTTFDPVSFIRNYCMKPYKMKAPNCALFSVAHAVCYIFPWKI